MSNGEKILKIAEKHIGEKYVLGSIAPKDNSSWRGPWDCAEFVSWCVYQTSKILYGCNKNNIDPAIADAYTGYWNRDAKETGKKISVEEAALIPGAVVLRIPGRKMGHIVISDGKGGTVEAYSSKRGVIPHKLSNRRWDTGILVPGIQYNKNEGSVPVPSPTVIYRLTSPYMRGETVRQVQIKLKGEGFDPMGNDGIFGPKTHAAVLSFQLSEGLLADGEVGPVTAEALGITLA